MDKLLLVQQLKQITGELQAATKGQNEHLKRLERKLAEQIIHNPGFTISGSNLHQAAIATVLDDSIESVAHINDVLAESTTKTIAPALAFRRETSMRSNLLGNSVAEWGSGLAANETMGPFIDKNGLEFYFDFFFSVHMIQVFISGVPYPVLLVPMRGILTAKKNYKISAGSVWIASNFITRKSAQLGYYTGLKVKGGSLDFDVNTIITDGKLYTAPATPAKLHLDLDHNNVNTTSTEAGFDATKAAVHLPEFLTFEFNLTSSKFTAGDANCTAFGCKTNLHFQNGKPVWQPLLQQILVPYHVTAGERLPDHFRIHQSLSELATLSSAATILSSSGWLLPAAKIDPLLLGNAAGTGAICIHLKAGLNASWKGLKGGKCNLNDPFIICEPGMLSVIDFTADNIYGKQRWKLWKNDHSEHQSEINIGLAASFPFVFISNSNGSEIVSFLCNFRAALDRPVASNGAPFRIESAIALVMISQTAKVFKAMILDTNLWFDIKADGSAVTNPEGYKKYSIALRNMLFNTT
ncbi:MAG: hypothetical protein ABIS01_12080, partial [Ferruginibacter sp.]